MSKLYTFPALWLYKVWLTLEARCLAHGRTCVSVSSYYIQLNLPSTTSSLPLVLPRLWIWKTIEFQKYCKLQVLYPFPILFIKTFIIQMKKIICYIFWSKWLPIPPPSFKGGVWSDKMAPWVKALVVSLTTWVQSLKSRIKGETRLPKVAFQPPHGCQPWHGHSTHKQFAGVGSFPVPYVSWRSNLGHQAWWQACSPTEPSL